MTTNKPTRIGSILNYGGRRQYLDSGKLSRCKKYGWYGVAYNWGKQESFRVWSPMWFPVGSILVADSALDIDLFVINPEATIEANCFDTIWLKTNQPKEETGTIFLDPGVVVEEKK